MIQRLLLGLVLLTSLTLVGREASALDDPQLTYHTIHTPHFHVHYASGWRDLALRTAQISEEAHEILSPLMRWKPASKTHVWVTDQLDTANGSATAYARNHMNIFGMPPESDSVLGYYDDWLRILVYHEYVHVLQLDTTLGLNSLINRVIGKQVNPNQLLPRWFIEGLAVYHESARTGTGRINSSLYQMWLRAEALHGGTFDLGQVTGSPVRWPFGSAAYLFGAYFMDFIARRHGEEFFTRFAHGLGERLIPYSMNQLARELSGETFEQMWDVWWTELKAKSLAQAIATRARGQTPLRLITRGGVDNKFPRQRPKSPHVSYYKWNFKDHPTFAMHDSTTGQEIELFEVDGAHGTSNWTPDGKHLLFTRTTVHRNVYRYQDLYRYSIERGTITRLTTAERAREPAASPDGKRVAYVRNRRGTMELVVRGLDGGVQSKERVLVSGLRHRWDDPRHWQQIATPVWTPDGRGVVFSWWRGDLRQRDLWVYWLDRPAATALEPMMRDEAVDIDPTFGPDGLLYFSSDRTGVFNIYAREPDTGRTWQVTDVVLGAFSPAPTPDGKHIHITTYSHRGYDIARVDRPKTWTRAARVSAPAKPWRRYPKIDTSTWVMEDYDAVPWLAPLTFLPNIAALNSGLLLGGSVSGFDPLERHIYDLSVGALLGSQGDGFRPNISASYRWRGGPVNVTAQASLNRFVRTDNLFAESRFIPYLENRERATLALDYPFARADDSWTLRLSYDVDHRGYFGEPPPINPEPGDLEPIPPELGWFNQVRASIIYNNLERYPLSVSTERGLSAYLTFGIMNPAVGADFESLALQYGGTWAAPNPWWDRHALHLSVAGGFVETNFRQRASYSIGGIGPQNVLASILFVAPTGGLVVRGYDPFAQNGNQYLVANAEYRFPLLDLEQGFSTAPLFFRQLKGRVFFDAGTAYDGFLGDANVLMSAGAEAQLSALFGYYLGGTLRLGYAYGFDPELGRSDLYLLYGGGF